MKTPWMALAVGLAVQGCWAPANGTQAALDASVADSDAAVELDGGGPAALDAATGLDAAAPVDAAPLSNDSGLWVLQVDAGPRVVEWLDGGGLAGAACQQAPLLTPPVRLEGQDLLIHGVTSDGPGSCWSGTSHRMHYRVVIPARHGVLVTPTALDGMLLPFVSITHACLPLPGSASCQWLNAFYSDERRAYLANDGAAAMEVVVTLSSSLASGEGRFTLEVDALPLDTAAVCEDAPVLLPDTVVTPGFAGANPDQACAATVGPVVHYQITLPAGHMLDLPHGSQVASLRQDCSSCSQVSGINDTLQDESMILVASALKPVAWRALPLVPNARCESALLVTPETPSPWQRLERGGRAERVCGAMVMHQVLYYRVDIPAQTRAVVESHMQLDDDDVDQSLRLVDVCGDTECLEAAACLCSRSQLSVENTGPTPRTVRAQLTETGAGQGINLGRLVVRFEPLP